MADINIRALNGGGIVRTLPSQLVNIYAGAPGEGANWFGPMAPLPPMAPPAVAGRTWDFPQAFNLQSSTDRPYQLIPFELLKNLADSYGLLRIIIETRKDQMAALELTARPKDKDKADSDPGFKAKIQKAKDWLASPYPGIDWQDWLRRLMEDLFVYDAPALFPRRTKGGQLYGVKPIAGKQINPLLDDWGDRPEPPNPGYVQRLKNLGAVHYCKAVGFNQPGVDPSLPQLIYKPRNPRNDSPFGFGPVEQIITIVNIGIRRETWQLNYFTEGNLPDALIGTPMEWTPDQLRNFQDWFDSRLMGTARRHGATFVPGDVAKGYVATKDTPLFGEAEEWLARVVCFAFSISPQWATKQVNRATAHTAKATAEEEGIEPLKLWLKTLIDFIFDKYLGLPDIVCDYVEEDDIDPAIQEQILTGYVNAGGITRNELRDALGKEKDPSPEASMLMITTAAGATPLTVKDQIAAQTAKNKAFPPPAGGGQYGADGKLIPPPGVPPGAGGGPPPGGGGPGGRGAGGKAGGAAAGGKARGGAPARAAPRAQPSDARAGAKKALEEALKYSADQPRDEHGRFTSGGGQDAYAQAIHAALGHLDTSGGREQQSSNAHALEQSVDDDEDFKEPEAGRFGSHPEKGARAAKAGGFFTDGTGESTSTEALKARPYEPTDEQRLEDAEHDSTAGEAEGDNSDEDDTGDDPNDLDPEDDVDSANATPQEEADQEDAVFDDDFDNEFDLARQEAAQARDALTAFLEDIFGAAKEERIAKALEKINQYKDQTGQDTGWDPTFIQYISETISRELDLSPLVALLAAKSKPPVVDFLRGMLIDSSKAAIAQVGVDMTAELTDQVNFDALDYIRHRGAELVGKKWVDGELVDNPDAAWSIPEATREMLRQELIDGLEQNKSEPSIANAISQIKSTINGSYAFSDRRATLIAKTEISIANAAGKLNGWQRGAELTPDKHWGHAWQLSNDGNVCPVCIANHDQGVIDLDEAFESGDDAEPAHPGCQCTTTLHLIDSDGNSDDNEGDDGEDD